MQDSKHKILLVLTALTIIGELISIILWTANPTLPSGQQVRFTLAVDYIYAVVNAAVFLILNIVAFMLITKRNKMGSVLLIAASIINRVVSHPIFIGGAHLFFIIWTILLIIFAYIEYRKLSNRP